MNSTQHWSAILPKPTRNKYKDGPQLSFQVDEEDDTDALKASAGVERFPHGKRYSKQH